MSSNQAKITWVRHSQSTNERAFHELLTHIEEWVTETYLANRFEAIAKDFWIESLSFPTIIAFQENGAEPHHTPTDRALQSWEQILIDCWVTVHGWCSDMTRVVFFWEVDQKYRDIYDFLVRTTEKCIERIKPGVWTDELHNYGSEQLWEYSEYFIHALGHGVSDEIHADPKISPKVHEQLQVGEILAIEPGIYIPGEIGSRYEQLVEVTEEGCEAVTHVQAYLYVK